MIPTVMKLSTDVFNMLGWEINQIYDSSWWVTSHPHDLIRSSAPMGEDRKKIEMVPEQFYESSQLCR